MGEEFQSQCEAEVGAGGGGIQVEGVEVVGDGGGEVAGLQEEGGEVDAGAVVVKVEGDA